MSGLASGNAILIPFKILALPVGSFVQHFPSQLVLRSWTFSRCWLYGKKKKEGQISSSLDLPGEWFSSRDPNLKLLLPNPPVVVYNLWRTQRWTVNLLAPMGLAKYAGKRRIGILTHNIKNQVYYSYGYTSALCWALHSTLKIIAFM